MSTYTTATRTVMDVLFAKKPYWGDELTVTNHGGQLRTFVTDEGIGMVYSYSMVIAVFFTLTKKAIVTNEKRSVTTSRHAQYARVGLARQGYEVREGDPLLDNGPDFDEHIAKGGKTPGEASRKRFTHG